jgi:hypothetical protein
VFVQLLDSVECIYMSYPVVQAVQHTIITDTPSSLIIITDHTNSKLVCLHEAPLPKWINIHKHYTSIFWAIFPTSLTQIQSFLHTCAKGKYMEDNLIGFLLLASSMPKVTFLAHPTKILYISYLSYVL